MAKREDQIIEHIIARMRSDASVDAPDDAIKYAKNLFRSRAVEQAPSMLRQVIAILKMDLAPGRPIFGERSGTGAQGRQMMFEADENMVDLRVTATTNGFDIRGQILGPGFETGNVALEGGEDALTAEIDAGGGFAIKGVPEGNYRAVFTGSDREVVVEVLRIG